MAALVIALSVGLALAIIFVARFNRQRLKYLAITRHLAEQLTDRSIALERERIRNGILQKRYLRIVVSENKPSGKPIFPLQ